MLKRYGIAIIFCLSLITIAGCKKATIHMTFDSIQTCQTFCSDMHFVGEKNQIACNDACQKLETTHTEKVIKKDKISAPIQEVVIYEEETMTTDDCSKICTNLWPTNDQEKANCMVSCTSEISE